MLEQISYIDDCDTLGQEANKIDIHKASFMIGFRILRPLHVTGTSISLSEPDRILQCRI
jgi:hypothetical protein